MRRAGHARGSTLIEAVVAIAILTTGAVSLCGLASLAVRTMTFTHERTMAAVLASQKLEALAAVRWGSVRSSLHGALAGGASVAEYLDAAGNLVTGGPAAGRLVYVRRWSVDPLAADAALDLIQVAVSRCRPVSAMSPECGNGAAAVRLVTIRSSAAW